MPKKVPPKQSRRVYPLNILFVITAGFALLSALLTPLLRSLTGGTVGLADVVLSSAAGGVFGCTIGALIGLYHHRRLRGLLWGVVTGLLIGSALGPLSLVRAEAAPALFGLSATGALLLVVAAAVFRLAAREGH